MATMTESNQRKVKRFVNFVIILFTILSSNSLLVNSEPELLITQQITTCKENSPGSILLKFTSNAESPEVSVGDTFELTNTSDNETGVRLKKKLDENTSSCTVIIAFLASLCLILFTALALALIILRRKKPITFKFGQSEDRDYDRKEFSESPYEENYEQTNKQSIDVTNSNLMNAKNSSKDSPRTSLPRKSSLKPQKNSLSDQMNNNFSSRENPAYNGGDLEVVDEISEEKEVEDQSKNGTQEGRRKSIVTFSDTTQVNYG